MVLCVLLLVVVAAHRIERYLNMTTTDTTDSETGDYDYDYDALIVAFEDFIIQACSGPVMSLAKRVIAEGDVDEKKTTGDRNKYKFNHVTILSIFTWYLNSSWHSYNLRNDSTLLEMIEPIRKLNIIRGTVCLWHRFLEVGTAIINDLNLDSVTSVPKLDTKRILVRTLLRASFTAVAIPILRKSACTHDPCKSDYSPGEDLFIIVPISAPVSVSSPTSTSVGKQTKA
jgi:hypothetical protein